MPWHPRKRKCKQKTTGKQGSYAVVKVHDDDSEEQVSCHTSEEKAKASIRAKHMNAGRVIRLTPVSLRKLIREVVEDVMQPISHNTEQELDAIAKQFHKDHDIDKRDLTLQDLLDDLDDIHDEAAIVAYQEKEAELLGVEEE